jgi:hypothetical protein
MGVFDPSLSARSVACSDLGLEDVAALALVEWPIEATAVRILSFTEPRHSRIFGHLILTSEIDSAILLEDGGRSTGARQRHRTIPDLSRTTLCRRREWRGEDGEGEDGKSESIHDFLLGLKAECL